MNLLMPVRYVYTVHRGIAKRGENELHVDMAELLLKDYPYAEDGLLVWDAIVKYFNEYLRMYYSDDARSGKQVSKLQDALLQPLHNEMLVVSSVQHSG